MRWLNLKPTYDLELLCLIQILPLDPLDETTRKLIFCALPRAIYWPGGLSPGSSPLLLLALSITAYFLTKRAGSLDRRPSAGPPVLVAEVLAAAAAS